MRSLTAILGCLTVAATCPAQNWTEIKPSTSPPVRVMHAMAYDSARQRTVLFGGGEVQRPYALADTWEWDGRNWTRRNPTTSPSARLASSMVYDSARQRTVLFGGANLSTHPTDTWEWDGRNWTKMNPITSPPGRMGFAMSYDSARQLTVLFGGVNPSGALGDTWEWNGRNWMQIKPATSPPAHPYVAMAYDSVRQRTVLFGGYLGIALGTWEWDGRNWTRVNSVPSPPPRWFPALVYDSARQRTVLFGGGGLGDTWEWNGTNWTRITPIKSPPARDFAEMTYDSVRQRTVLFGGQVTGGYVADTWEYGIANLTLTANTPTISIANGGTQTLTLNAGADLKNKSYWIFGSETSTMPGVVLTGIHIPLNPDLYTIIAMGAVNGKEFTKFRATLDATGLATASFNIPANLPFPTGFKLYHAYVVYDATTGHVFTSSNPVSVQLK